MTRLGAGAGGAPRHLHGPVRPGRPGADGHRRPEPQPAVGLAAGRGPRRCSRRSLRSATSPKGVYCARTVAPAGRAARRGDADLRKPWSTCSDGPAQAGRGGGSPDGLAGPSPKRLNTPVLRARPQLTGPSPPRASLQGPTTTLETAMRSLIPSCRWRPLRLVPWPAAPSTTNGRQSNEFFVTSVNPGRGADFGGTGRRRPALPVARRRRGAGHRTWRAYLSTTARARARHDARDRIGRATGHNVQGRTHRRQPDELHGVNQLNKADRADREGRACAGSGDRATCTTS
jgi:hypothetical protein